MLKIDSNKLGEIIVENIQGLCKLGIYESERIRGQAVIIDLIVTTDMSKANYSDEMNDSLSYVDISLCVQDVCKAKEYNLIEHLSQCIVDDLFEKFPLILAIEAKVHKPIINAEGFSGNAYVRIKRERS
jgi:dihydroneopterin aldolase